MSKSFWKGLVTGLVAGASVGAVAGLLSAPKSGKELREDLQNYFAQLSGEVQKRMKDFEVVSHDMYERIVDEVIETYEKAKNFDREDVMALRDALLREWENMTQGNGTEKARKPARRQTK